MNEYSIGFVFFFFFTLSGTPPSIDKSSTKSIVSTWLDSLSSTVKYGNQAVFDAVHKRRNGVVSALPNKILYSGHTTT